VTPQPQATYVPCIASECMALEMLWMAHACKPLRLLFAGKLEAYIELSRQHKLKLEADTRLVRGGGRGFEG
jgi:hypothetical protein